MTRLVLRSSLLAAFVAWLPACSSSGATDGSVVLSGLSACGEGDAAIAGITYDVSKSLLAFGGAPVESADPMGTRWAGPNAWVVTAPNGWTSGIAGGEEGSRPDWTNDSAALTERMKVYFASLGLQGCQIEASEHVPLGGGFSAPLRGISFTRAIDGIPVSESKLTARLNDHERTTAETLFWPVVPREVVVEARAFRDRLTDPTALATYKRSLPALVGSDGEGQVAIHHTAIGTKDTKFAVTWDTVRKGKLRSFDETGAEVSLSSL